MAGTACENRPVTSERIKSAAELAARTREALEAGQQKVYLLGRIGQDLSEYGVIWSHLGFVVKDKDDAWTVYHELNECGTQRSGLFAQGLLEFFSDDLFQFRAAVSTLPQSVQQRLVERLEASAVRALHEPRYNMVAYPFSTEYQNSNQWVLEMLAAASSEKPITTRQQAQVWLQNAGFEPTQLVLLATQRLGARMFKANVAFDDHPAGLRFTNRIRTTTADAVLSFVKRRWPEVVQVELGGAGVQR